MEIMRLPMNKGRVFPEKDKKQKRKCKSDGLVMDLNQLHEDMNKNIKPSAKPKAKPINLAMDIFQRKR